MSAFDEHERRRAHEEACREGGLLREKVRKYMAPLTVEEMVRMIREDRDRSEGAS